MEKKNTWAAHFWPQIMGRRHVHAPSYPCVWTKLKRKKTWEKETFSDGGRGSILQERSLTLAQHLPWNSVG